METATANGKRQSHLQAVDDILAVDNILTVGDRMSFVPLHQHILGNRDTRGGGLVHQNKHCLQRPTAWAQPYQGIETLEYNGVRSLKLSNQKNMLCSNAAPVKIII